MAVKERGHIIPKPIRLKTFLSGKKVAFERFVGSGGVV